MKGDDDVIVCNSNNIIERYRNPGNHVKSEYLNNTDKTIGIFDPSVILNNEWLVCNFSRQDSNSAQANYFEISQNNEYYILAAHGYFNNTGIKCFIILLFFKLFILLRIKYYLSDKKT